MFKVFESSVMKQNQNGYYFTSNMATMIFTNSISILMRNRVVKNISYD